MIIGLYDADYANEKRFFNIDLMKLAGYYKKRGEIVKLSPLFIPDKYSKFLYAKESADGQFHTDLFKYDNIEYFGNAFHPGKSIGLPSEIEVMPPDTSIYAVFNTNQLSTQSARNFHNTMTINQHMRLSSNGIDLNPDWKKQINRDHSNILIVHDLNLSKINGGFEATKESCEILRQGGKRIYLLSRHPIIIDDLDDICKWEAAFNVSVSTRYQHNGLFTNDFLPAIIDDIKIPGRGLKNRIICFVDTRSQTDHFFKEDIIEIFRQLMFLRSHHRYFSLKYEDNFFMQQGWGKVLQYLDYYFTLMIERYGNNFKGEGKSLKDFAYYQSILQPHWFTGIRPFTTQEVREIFAFVRIHNYELFKLFYECRGVELKGGKLYDKS